MTQVKSAQAERQKVALRKRAETPSLAQRRAAFAAQMREMALSELSDVSKRLKDLHREWEKKDGRKWTHYELAAAMDIAPRTFQSWENGEVENRDGKGYDKFAKFYSRKLGRKITRHWILYGANEPGESGDFTRLEKEAAAPPATDREVATQLAALAKEVRALRAQQTKLLARLAKAEGTQQGQRQRRTRRAQGQ